MRTTLAMLACLVLFAACGGDDDGEARKAKIANLRKQYQALNAEFAEKSVAWLVVRNALIPARSAMLHAKKSEDEGAAAAAKQAFEEAQAAASDVIQQEQALQGRIRDLKDEIKRLGGKP
jgi:chromosome segregation ATPase